MLRLRRETAPAPDTRSDSGSSIDTITRKSIKHEVDVVAGVSVKERNRQSLTICVARGQSLRELEEAGQYVRKFFERGVFKREAPPVLFTTVEGLQDTIDEAQLSAKHRTLNLLFSPEIEDITFNVPSHFSQLKVLRCDKPRSDGILFVDGSSTYNNVRLDKWQAHRHKNHTLVIGHERGVRIKLAELASLPHWARCRDNFDDAEVGMLRQHFESLSGKSRWDEVKDTVAAIVGIATGAVKMGVRLSGATGGVYVKYTFGMHAVEIGAAGAKMSLVTTAAGGAVVLGVAAAAAVYFIPWESLFEWLKSALSCVWDKICSLWQRFRDWVMALFKDGFEVERSVARRVPVKRA